MTLETDQHPLIEDPYPADIAKALSALGDGFAVLARADQEYVQATVGCGGFLMERRAGAAVHHYQTRDTSISIERVIDCFQRYAHGDDSWVTEFEWNPLSRSG